MDDKIELIKKNYLNLYGEDSVYKVFMSVLDEQGMDKDFKKYLLGFIPVINEDA